MADIKLPQLGETVTEGTITRWFKTVGDTVAVDEPLFEVSTDKVDTEVPSPIAGVVAEIRVAEGATAEVGAIVAVVAEVVGAEQPEPAGAPAPQPSRTPEPPFSRVPEPLDETAPADAAPLLSPLVRRLVDEHDLRVDVMTGTGVGGRITPGDVRDHIDSLAARSAPAGPRHAPMSPPAATVSGGPGVTVGERDRTIALSKLRRLIGDHMVMSKATSPHAFSVVEVNYLNVASTRSAVKTDFELREGIGLTYLPFIARAIVDGLADFSLLNASVRREELVVHQYIDLGIAVDLDHEGVIAPVIRNAETKRLRALAREISDLADRARARRLRPDETSGGTFTISNNGSVGSVLTMPIINQPQVGIVSTDAVVRKPVATRTADGAEAIAIHPVGHLSMSWDHRAFDGAYAAGFLRRVKEILETRRWAEEF